MLQGLIRKLKEQQPFSLRFNPQKYWDRRAKKNGLDSVMQDPKRNELEQKFIAGILNHPDFDGVKSVLDYGCGVGRFLPLLKDRFPQVWATDFSYEMIKKAQLIVRDVEFCTSEQLPPVDMVFCFTVLLHIISNREWRRTLERLCKVSKYIVICDQFKGFLTARHCKVRRVEDYLKAVPGLEWCKFYPDGIDGLGVLILKIKQEHLCVT